MEENTQKSSSGLAIASLVLGIIAIVTSFLPIINNLSFILALVGLILGVVAIIIIRKGAKKGMGLAVAGTVLGIVSIVVVLATQAAFSAALDEALDEVNSGTTSSATTGESGSSAAASAESQAAKYAVTIDNCTVTTDYQDNPAIVVDYTFTNNSDEATSFMVATIDKAFQNGVELDTGMVMNINNEAAMKDIKPGASVQVQQAFKLADQSDVTVEVEELLSMNDTLLAERTFTVA